MTVCSTLLIMNEAYKSLVLVPNKYLIRNFFLKNQKSNKSNRPQNKKSDLRATQQLLLLLTNCGFILGFMTRFHCQIHEQYHLFHGGILSQILNVCVIRNRQSHIYNCFFSLSNTLVT